MSAERPADMGSGASFYLVGVSRRLSRKPILKTRGLRGFNLCSPRSSPYPLAGKALKPPCCPISISGLVEIRVDTVHSVV